jgi:hypothetical protein
VLAAAGFMWYTHATFKSATLAGVTCVSGEKRIAPGSWPYVGHSFADGVGAAAADCARTPLASPISPAAAPTAATPAHCVITRINPSSLIPYTPDHALPIPQPRASFPV